MKKSLYPLVLKPAYKDYLWGGDRIIKTYGRDEPDGIYAESWEVSTRSEGASTIANGDMSGKSLFDVVEAWGKDLLGTRTVGDDFPLLIKLIDAQQCLSVQVHPDDEAAARGCGEAKTECWHILRADPDAAVYAGFKDDVTQEDFEEAVEEKRSGDLLYRTNVAEGDTVFIPGGTVHAIDAGSLLLEVQQNSNTTFRIFDWNRVGPDGKERELHVEQAMDVIHWEPAQHPVVSPQQIFDKSGNERWVLVESPYFRLQKIRLHERESVDGAGATFTVLFVANGVATLTWGNGSETLKAGSTCLVPAALSGCAISPDEDATVVLHVTLPAADEVCIPEVVTDDE